MTPECQWLAAVSHVKPRWCSSLAGRLSCSPPSVLLIWPPLQPQSPLHSSGGWEGEWRNTCGKFLWTRPLWGTHYFCSQSFLRAQLHGIPNCKGGWERWSTCGPKRKRKLHSSSRIKKCGPLLLIPLLELLYSASYQVVLIFTLQCLSSLASSPFTLPPFFFHNPAPTLALLCFNPFAVPAARLLKGSRCLLQLCILSAYRHLINIKKCLLCEKLTH